MKNDFYNVSECKTAKADFEKGLSYDELMKKITKAVGSDTIVGAKVIEKNPNGLWLTFGYETKAFLEKKRCDITRKFSFIESIEIGSYINVNILSKADDSVFFVARDTIIKSAHNFHDKNITIGSVISATVSSVNDHFTYFDIGAGDTRGTLHASNIREAYVSASLTEYFVSGQEVNLQVKEYNSEFNSYELVYKNVRQPNGIKTNTVVQAYVTGAIEGKKCTCSFPDFPMTDGGIISNIPKGYNIGSTIPVTVVDIKRNFITTKF